MDRLALLAEAREKGRLLGKAIQIIEKLSKNEMADIDLGYEDKSTKDIKNTIIEARSLTSDKWWRTLKED